MDFVKNIDWYYELRENMDNWTNHGRNVLEDSCKHKTDESGDNTSVEYSGYCEKCEISEDNCQPMMNYGYPLKSLPSEEQILKIVKNTCLTVMEDYNNSEYYLVLCGGGMDLSQSIALAYIYTGGNIPLELCYNVAIGGNFSVSKKDYKLILKEIKKTFNHEKKFIQNRKSRIIEELKKQ